MKYGTVHSNQTVSYRICPECKIKMKRLGGRYNYYECIKCGIGKDNLGVYH